MRKRESVRDMIVGFSIQRCLSAEGGRIMVLSAEDRKFSPSRYATYNVQGVNRRASDRPVSDISLAYPVVLGSGWTL